MAEHKEMTFIEHLDELRKHLMRSVIIVVAFMIVAFAFTEFIFEEILFGPAKADFWTYNKMCELGNWLGVKGLCVGVDLKLVNFTITGQFMTHLTSSIILGIVMAFPYIVWEIWRFVRPALYDKEINAAKGIVFYIVILFTIGILFGYFIITPISVNFLATYKISPRINPDNQFDLHSYISMVSWLTLISSLMFQLPIVAYFLGKAGILSASFMRSYRRHSIVVILIASAIITPSADIFSQLIVALPLYILYEMSIFIVAYTERKAAKLEALEKQEEEVPVKIVIKEPPRLDQMTDEDLD
ncbi:MAG: twin-arginine translocase subunit TatC [Raineya sp.]|jgi:sec-independent protein translocase protein TatC|nr:twin-arginine translocase subunit TatC [Raineya sp.]